MNIEEMKQEREYWIKEREKNQGMINHLSELINDAERGSFEQALSEAKWELKTDKYLGFSYNQRPFYLRTYDTKKLLEFCENSSRLLIPSVYLYKNNDFGNESLEITFYGEKSQLQEVIEKYKLKVDLSEINKKIKELERFCKYVDSVKI